MPILIYVDKDLYSLIINGRNLVKERAEIGRHGG